MNRNEIVFSALKANNHAVGRTLTQALRSVRPEWHIFEIEEADSIRRFAEAGMCQIAYCPDFAPDVRLSSHPDFESNGAFYRTYQTPTIYWFRGEFESHEFECLVYQVVRGYGQEAVTLLMGPSKESLEKLVAESDLLAAKVEGAVLVFDQGCWSKDEDLFKSIQSSNLENLVLPAAQKEQIVADISQWLDSKELYESHAIPWKRGMILVGPPGNGKTHTIKALINHFNLPALYVRSFVARHTPIEFQMKSVFRRARRTTPCILVLEDLDTLVTPETRSFFLNEMDGFSSNRGILTIATANDPAKLDPALVNRPSRFDRRYEFTLPALPERVAYLKMLVNKLIDQLQMTDEEFLRVGHATEDFSFAYLKELVLSGVMSWISHDRVRPLAEVLELLSPELRSQMRFEAEMPPPPARSSLDESLYD